MSLQFNTFFQWDKLQVELLGNGLYLYLYAQPELSSAEIFKG